MLKFLGVSLLSSANKKGGDWEHRLGTLEKAFHVEVPCGVTFSVPEAQGTCLGTQGTCNLKLLFFNSISEHPNEGLCLELCNEYLPDVSSECYESIALANGSSQDKPSRSDFPHFAMRVARDENAENAENLSLHTKIHWALRKLAARKSGKSRKCSGTDNRPESRGFK